MRLSSVSHISEYQPNLVDIIFIKEETSEIIFITREDGIKFIEFRFNISFLENFSHQHLVVDFHWSLSNSKFPQVSWTLLSILVDFSNASCLDGFDSFYDF